MNRSCCLPLVLAVAVGSAVLPHRAAALPEETPSVVGLHVGVLEIDKISGSFYRADVPANQSLATQMAFGPGPNANASYLYVASNIHPLRRFEYDPDTGALSGGVDVLSETGLGLAFHLDTMGRSELYLSNVYQSANAADADLSRLLRYVDVDADGVFGEPGDTSAAIAHGIPAAGHTLGQIQVSGDTLYVGSGTRTQNGGEQHFFLLDTFGDAAYSGAILVIDDLNQVPTSTNAAGFSAYLADPTLTEYENVITGITAGAESPFTSMTADKLRVHSAGTRNPFGLALDRHGDLFFTNNFHRVNNSVYDRSVTGAAAEPDSFDGDSNDDVHDQMFKAVAGADYGYRNSNWQGHASALAAGFFAGIADPTLIEVTVSFDNLDQDGPGGPDLDSLDPAFDQFHDPASPIGIGPHAGVAGLAFNGTAFPPRYHDKAFVARSSRQPLGLVYTDVVLVDASTGEIERVVDGLNVPTDVLADENGNLLVSNYRGSIWRITWSRAVPAMSHAPRVALALLLLAAGVAAARPR